MRARCRKEAFEYSGGIPSQLVGKHLSASSVLLSHQKTNDSLVVSSSSSSLSFEQRVMQTQERLLERCEKREEEDKEEEEEGERILFVARFIIVFANYNFSTSLSFFLSLCAHMWRFFFLSRMRNWDVFYPKKNRTPKTNETTLDLVNKTDDDNKTKKETLRKSHAASTEIGMVSRGIHQCNAISLNEQKIGFELRAFVLGRADLLLVISVEKFIYSKNTEEYRRL